MTEEEFRGRGVDAKDEAPEPLMQFFDYDDAPWSTKGILAGAFLSMACAIARQCPRNAERTVALRKLLEARDCAMRAAVMK